jgi:MFS family permease
MNLTAAINNRFPALSSKDFRIFWVGQFVSLIGTWMQNVTQPYLAYRISNQPFYLGLIGFSASLPALLFMLPGGVMVERMNKRNVVIAMQCVMMAQAFILAFLALTGQITIWHIVVLAFVLGTASSVEITARQAMLIELVGKEALPNAIALQSTIFNAARVLGPALAGPLLIMLQDRGEGWAFFANGVSYLVVIVGLFFVHPRAEYSSNTVARAGALTEFREGQRYILASMVIALLILTAAVPGFIGFPAIQQAPVFASDIFRQVGDTDASVAARYSAMVTAQGLGALIAAITLATFSTMRRKGRLLTIGQLVFAVSLVGLSFSRSLGVALPMMMFIGWGTVTQLAMTNTLIQLLVPNHLRGRVISTYFWAQSGVAPFGSLLVGWMAQSFGAPTAVLVCGAGCLGVALAVHAFTPSIRQVTA